MNNNAQRPRPLRSSAGMTLIELSIVILVLLMFLGMTFIGVRGWKRGADRAGCVMNIRHIQQAVRGFANSNNLNPGDDTSALATPVVLAGALIGPGNYLSSSPVCPGKGVYTFGGNVIPQAGALYMSCSLEDSEDHIPDQFAAW